MSGWNEAAWFALFVGVAVKGTAVLGAAWLAAWWLRGGSAAARHLVWTAAAAALLALPFLTASLPGLAVPGAGALLPDPGVVFEATASATVGSRPVSPGHPSDAATGTARQSTPWRPGWRDGLMLGWGAGAFIVLARMGLAWFGLRRMRHAASPSPDRGLSAQLARELGIRRRVDLLEISVGAMPMTFGILRPAICMPRDACEWSEDRRRVVLLHELAHVRRGDVATQLLARLALLLHWWNPLAWASWRAFLAEREHATDDLVLEAGTRASDYARHLLDVARTRLSTPPLAWAAVAMTRRSQLESRLAAILDARVQRRAAGRASALAAAVSAVVLVAPLAAVHAPQRMPAPILAPVENTARHSDAPAPEAPPAAVREEVPAADRGTGYGLGLMKIARLEQSRHRQQEAGDFYAKALQVLGDRPEAVPALMYLGTHSRVPAEAMDYLRRAARLDPAQTARARMWMALIREFQPDPAAAEALYRSALVAANPISADAESILQLYGRFLHKQGREEEAKQIEDRAKSVRQTLVSRAIAQQPAGTAAFRAGGDVKAPALLAKVEPEYSDDARQAKYQGTVVIYAVIGTDGLAHDMRVIKGLGLGLDDKAIEAIQRWHFRPGTRNGETVNVAATIEVNFRLL